MFAALASIVVTGIITIETQRQDLILRDILREQEILIDKTMDRIISIGKLGVDDSKVYLESLGSNLEIINLYYGSVRRTFIGFQTGELEYNKGNVIDLELSSTFRVDFDKWVQSSLNIWDEVEYLKNYLMNPSNLAARSEYASCLMKLIR